MVKTIRNGGLLERINRFLLQNLVLVGIILLCVVTTVSEPEFLSSNNITNIMGQFGSLSFVALGMTFVIIGGFIDLSVVGLISLVGVVTISLIDQIGQLGALCSGILLGAALGALTGVVLISFGAMTQAEVLFITFGMSSVYGALALLYTNAGTEHLSRLNHPYHIFTTIGSGKIGIFAVSFLLFIICLILLDIFHKRTFLGRKITLMGGNKVAANLCGYNMKHTMIMVYMICGIMASIASIVLLSRVTTASPTSGVGYETNAILSVVVGGTTLAGGRGSALRTVLGVLLITLLSNCLNMLGVSTYMQTVLKGMVLIIAIWLDNRKEQQKN